jgi:ADP-ribose pyrophosphatase YjhB (NUDIX family)
MSSNRFLIRSAVYLLLQKDNKILLSRRFNTGWMDGHYSLVSGHLDGGEPVSIAMVREAREEAGITINPQDLIPATVLHRQSSNYEYIDFFFVCTQWGGEPVIMEKDKCDDLSWFDLDHLPQNMLPYINEVIQNYKNKTAFSESGWN